MLRKYIEGRERALYARDDNRKSLPFDWGLEHVGLDLLNEGDPEAALRDYARDALCKSDEFYAYETLNQHEFDGHILKFPSAVQTPYVTNNLVWGRFFGGSSRDLAVLLLHHWNCK